jgi:hypothetical protein
MNLKKPIKGQPVEFYASTFGAMIDAAVANREGGSTAPAARQTIPQNSTIITVQNTTGDDLDRFAAVKLDAPVILPDDNEGEFTRRIAFKVVTPDDASAGLWAVIQQPLAKGPTGSEANGAFGTAVVLGMTHCVVNILDTDDTHVEVADGQTIPTSGTEGTASIIWAAGWEDGTQTADETGEQLAIIRIGGGGSGGEGLPDAGDQHTVLKAVSQGVWGVDFTSLH